MPFEGLVKFPGAEAFLKEWDTDSALIAQLLTLVSPRCYNCARAAIVYGEFTGGDRRYRCERHQFGTVYVVERGLPGADIIMGAYARLGEV